MKKLFFCLGLVLGLFQTPDVCGLEIISAHSFEIAGYESTHFYQNSPGENLYLAVQQIDIEEDEITDPIKHVFLIHKIAIDSYFLETGVFQAAIFSNSLITTHNFHRQHSHFISLRVLKI